MIICIIQFYAKFENKNKVKMLRNPKLWLSYKEHIGDALALGADEGRDKLR